MDAIDIWRTAAEMIRQFQDEAGATAAKRAAALHNQGDLAGCIVWRQVARAIDGLQRIKPVQAIQSIELVRYGDCSLPSSFSSARNRFFNPASLMRENA